MKNSLKPSNNFDISKQDENKFNGNGFQYNKASLPFDKTIFESNCKNNNIQKMNQMEKNINKIAEITKEEKQQQDENGNSDAKNGGYEKWLNETLKAGENLGI